MKLSVIVPVYNEASTIREILDRAEATPFDKEIIVIDDGSTDGTGEILASIHQPNVQIITHPRNLGKGTAVRTGFKVATGDYVIVQDADLEYDPRDYTALLQPLIEGDADVVYGSRFTGGPRRVLYFWHAVGNQLLTLLSNMLTGLNLTDMETGYKVFRIEVVHRLWLNSKRFGIEPEITAKIARLGCRVYEVPISYRGRTYTEGKKIRWTDGLAAGAAIVRYALLPGQLSEHAGMETLSATEGLRHYNAWLWNRLSPYVGTRVFEAGCGTGTITAFLLRCQRLVCTDVDEHYVATLQRRYADRSNVRVAKLDLTSPRWPDLRAERIDTVICMNVLEHLSEDQPVLRRFYDVLQPGGRLVLLVPAHQWLYGSIDEAIGHYRRYERDQLRAVCGGVGFEVERAEYLNPSGVFGWFLNGPLLKRRAVPALQARLYDALFPLLAWTQALGLPFGLSVLLIGRKPANQPA